MSETKRIRWEDGLQGCRTGYVGTRERRAFTIWPPLNDADKWMLDCAFSDVPDDRAFGDGPGELKAEAERWLAEFVSSLGAVFPDERAKSESAAVMLLLDHDDGSLVDVVVYEDGLKAESEAQETAEDTGYQVQVWTGRPVVSGTLAPETSAPGAGKE